MKTLLLTSILSALLSGTPSTPPVKSGILPEKCPSIASISSQGLDYVAPFIPGTAWIGIKENSHYDTNNAWTFMFFSITETKNGKTALQQLSKNISSYHLKAGPEWSEEMGLAVCEYEIGSGNGNGDVAVTFSPSLYE